MVTFYDNMGKDIKTTALVFGIIEAFLILTFWINHFLLMKNKREIIKAGNLILKELNLKN